MSDFRPSNALEHYDYLGWIDHQRALDKIRADSIHDRRDRARRRLEIWDLAERRVKNNDIPGLLGLAHINKRWITDDEWKALAFSADNLISGVSASIKSLSIGSVIIMSKENKDG